MKCSNTREEMEDEEEDSFYQPVQFSVPIRSTNDAKKVKTEEPTYDSDDSFDNFEVNVKPAISIEKSSALSSTPRFGNIDIPSTSNSSNVNGNSIVVRAAVRKNNSRLMNSSRTFSRHESDNSFFRENKANDSRNNKISPISSTRPGTPSGEMLMLRSLLENERKEKAKMISDWQKSVKEIHDKHLNELSAKDEEYKKLLTENEMLKTITKCKKFDRSATEKDDLNTSPLAVPVRKVSVKIGSSNFFKPSVSDFKRNNITPRRAPQLSRQLSAFRHETHLRLPNRQAPHISGEEFVDEDTFQLENSFEPSATSTPKAGILKRPIQGLRDFKQHYLDEIVEDEERGAPSCKKVSKTMENLKIERKIRTKTSLKDVRDKLENVRKEAHKLVGIGGNENFTENDKIVENLSKDSFYNKNDNESDVLSFYNDFDKLTIKKKNDSKLTKSKLKEAIIKFEEKSKPKCSRCVINELFEAGGSKTKQWKMREMERISKNKERREYDIQLMVSSSMRKMSKNCEGNLEERIAERQDLEKKINEKECLEEIRSLKEIRNEVRDGWRGGYMAKLEEVGEFEANYDFADAGNNDWVWTSSDDESVESNVILYPERIDIDYGSLCEMCSEWQRKQKRHFKRELEQAKVKMECLNEYGAEQREKIRNMTILTKSKIEKADNELREELNELVEGGVSFEDDLF